MGYVTLPTESSGLGAPDYDSGCFSLAADTYIEKIHNLGTKILLPIVLFAATDTDCNNDGATNTGRPLYAIASNSNYYHTYATSINSITIVNKGTSTFYYRILIWKGV